MNEINPKVDFYFRKSKIWRKELEHLRSILLGYDLMEELKWGVPCYLHNQRNIVLIHEFKEYCAVLFFKGVLLKDPHQVLIQQTKNSQTARQIRFTSVEQIVEMEPILKAYVDEAIEVEKAGLQVQLKETSEFEVPEEFQNKLEELPELKTAFEALTPGRQRAYLLHFAAVKQSKTREALIDKCLPLIFEGKGLND